MIFLDTSAIYALQDETDLAHDAATQLFERILQERTPVVTHNYVVVEALALIQGRFGLAAALTVERELRQVEIIWIDNDIHHEASIRWAKGSRKLSFVDHVSFVVMERHQIHTALAFDSDFVGHGFNVLTATRRR